MEPVFVEMAESSYLMEKDVLTKEEAEAKVKEYRKE